MMRYMGFEPPIIRPHPLKALSASPVAIAVLASSALGLPISASPPSSPAVSGSTAPAAQAPVSVDALVQMAVAANPQVRAAKAQYLAAMHQIKQAYAPNDPLVSWLDGQSPTGFGKPTLQTLEVSESFQFPGKAWLQGDNAHRNAEISRLAYLAAVRDAKAQVKTAYYQALLDGALADTAAENAMNINLLRQVARVAYVANQVPQSDVINAEFDLTAASQTYLTSRIAEQNDEATINQILGRDPRTPLQLVTTVDIEPLHAPLDMLLQTALAVRQEVLQAALAEKNSATALKLAHMEVLPDFTVSYFKDRWPLVTGAPAPNVTTDNGASIGMNIPVFYIFKQREDAKSAEALLEAARANLRNVELQTQTSITQLYRTTNLAFKVASRYHDSLIPLARQSFQVALIAYQSRKADFAYLATTLQRIYTARINYLTAVNQHLAGRTAIEQAVGGPIHL